MREPENAPVQRVGMVRALYRYPVKSMRGEAIRSVRVGIDGFDGDRRAAFVSVGTPAFLLTARQLPTLLRYAPSFQTPDRPNFEAIQVKTPDGRKLALSSDELRAELIKLAGVNVQLMDEKHGIFDEMPISLISQQTVYVFGNLLAKAIDPRRFRPNILIETYHPAPFQEEQWIGHTLRFGDRSDSVWIGAEGRDERCMIVNLDPETGEQETQILRTIARSHQTQAGIYCTPTQPGSIRVGDTVYLIKQ